jgi:drug/metabolite transporter (DMT)-like permease
MLIVYFLYFVAFSGSFLVLMSLTSPVLSSVAALLTIFIIAIVDWLLTGKPLSVTSIAGGLLIVAAFILLSWSTYRELSEEKRLSEGPDSESDD